MIDGKNFLLATQIRGGKKTQVKNYSAELFFSFHFGVFEVQRFRNPTNKISMALVTEIQISKSFGYYSVKNNWSSLVVFSLDSQLLDRFLTLCSSYKYAGLLCVQDLPC
jgi:hypothetical protein